MRRREEERDRRRSRLGVVIVTAIAECDERVRAPELRAGQALRSLIEEEGLTVGEAAEWCGLPDTEVSRLRRAVPATGDAQTEPATPGRT